MDSRADLIGHWPFDGNFDDAVGEFDGEEVNGALLGDDRFGNPRSGSGYAYLSRPDGYPGNDLNGWISQARAGATDLGSCNDLVIDQERANKTSRARLRPNAKDEHVDGWIGLSELDYRLPQVRTLVEDIQRGESGKADPDVGR